MRDVIPRSKMVNLAALILLLFGALWLALFAAGMSGVAWLAASRWVCLLQGLAAWAAVCVLVARLSLAPVVAGALSLLILFAPMLAPVGSPSFSVVETAGVTEQALQTSAAQLALPASLRDELHKTLALNAHRLGFQDHPAQVKELNERRERIDSWLLDHRGSLASIQAKVPGSPSVDQLPERVYKALGTDDGGEDWTWITQFLVEARKAGLNDAPTPLSEEDRKAAEQHAAEWLRTHPELIGGAMTAYENENAPDLDQAWQSQKSSAGSMMALWIVLPAMYAVFQGLVSFQRPFVPASLPSWILTGLGLLLRQKNGRPEPAALLRVGAGLASMVAGVVLIALITAAGISGAKVVMVLTVGSGGMLLVSGLNLNDDTIDLGV